MIKPFARICIASGLPAPVTEHRFHPVRKWRFDWSWPDYKVALEIEGGVWRRGGGAHSHPINITRDIEKYSEAAAMGWRIIRCQPRDIYSAQTMDWLRRALNT